MNTTATMAANGAANKNESRPVDENISEEDRIKLMFENQSNAWAQTQDELSTHKVVYNKPSATGTNPEDIPPQDICVIDVVAKTIGLEIVLLIPILILKVKRLRGLPVSQSHI